ncbi:unnamed protein product [Adineta ricciae]|uniref:peptide-O-fucosyltransferase n=1 Tax=Adineta ricciae TaxID=249248 RepID=A0A814MMS5_ADIRI|nr:unnamed protein product [Adineta ricciae]CAF1569558.1 unnamed protein product [Adineta ricciae]
MEISNVTVWLNMRRKYILGGCIGFLVFLLLFSINLSSGEFSLIEPAGRSPLTQELRPATNLYYWNNRKVKTVNYSYWPRALETKYLAWKSWHGRFNNERISLELAFVFAALLNRTLVLPPVYDYFNLKEFMYEKFFEIDDMRKAISVVTFDDFAAQEGITADYGNIASKATVLHWPEFPNAESIFVYPEIPNKEKEPGEWAKMEKFARKRRMGKLRDIKTDPAMVNDRIIYFPDHQLLAHFYAYIYIRDPQLDRYMKRLVRDHLHIRDDIYDTANVILEAMPKKFYAIHFRRGDFQYQDQRHLTGQTILNNLKPFFPVGSTIYLATDETDKAILQKDFLQYFGDYKIITYGDFEHLVSKYIQPHWVGIIEQIICSRGESFVGTKLSTYSGYITRIRGYSPDIVDKAIYFTDTKYPDGYKDENLFSKNWPRWGDYWLEHGLWAREFQESWEIDG